MAARIRAAQHLGPVLTETTARPAIPRAKYQKLFTQAQNWSDTLAAHPTLRPPQSNAPKQPSPTCQACGYASVPQRGLSVEWAECGPKPATERLGIRLRLTTSAWCGFAW
jgi:hypothetical protein